jgi:hypothetical protein
LFAEKIPGIILVPPYSFQSRAFHILDKNCENILANRPSLSAIMYARINIRMYLLSSKKSPRLKPGRFF